MPTKSSRSGRSRCRNMSARNMTVPVSTGTRTVSRLAKSLWIWAAISATRRCVCAAGISTRAISPRHASDALGIAGPVLEFLAIKTRLSETGQVVAQVRGSLRFRVERDPGLPDMARALGFVPLLEDLSPKDRGLLFLPGGEHFRRFFDP